MGPSHVPIDLEPLRAVPGALPPQGATEVAGVQVPAGGSYAIPGVGERAVRATVEPLSHPLPTITALQCAFARTGLWPMLTDDTRLDTTAEVFGWWHDPTLPVIDGEDVLFGRWQEFLQGDESPLLREWPGRVTPAQPGGPGEVSPLGDLGEW